MHRTLKAETAKRPASTMAEQQARFDAFRQHYNEERPHEALDQTPPAQHWQRSPRPLPDRLDDPRYDADHQVRRMTPKVTRDRNANSVRHQPGRTELLHDIGKYSTEFQKRLDGSEASVDHSTAGAQLATALYGTSIGHILGYAVAGHHGGMPSGSRPRGTFDT